MNGSVDADAYPSLFDWQVSYVKPCARVPVVGTVSCPLPIQLLDFSGAANQHKTVLSWSTGLEVNNDHFLVQRSTDGVQFETIGTVNGNGNSKVILNYSFTDEKPVNGLVYYKLIQVDADGAETASKVISVSQDNSGTVNIFPNPFSQGANLIVNSAGNYKINVRLYDLTGKILYESDEHSSNESILVGENLPEGAYVVEVLSVHEKTITRLIKITK